MNTTTVLTDEERYDRAFCHSIKLLAAEDELETTTDDERKAELDKEIARLNQNITPAAKVAALETRYSVLDEWDKWVAAENPENVAQFLNHLQSVGGAMRTRKGSSAAVKIGAVRKILSTWRNISGAPGRPKKWK